MFSARRNSKQEKQAALAEPIRSTLNITKDELSKPSVLQEKIQKMIDDFAGPCLIRHSMGGESKVLNVKLGKAGVDPSTKSQRRKIHVQLTEFVAAPLDNHLQAGGSVEIVNFQNGTVALSFLYGGDDHIKGASKPVKKSGDLFVMQTNPWGSFQFLISCTAKPDKEGKSVLYSSKEGRHAKDLSEAVAFLRAPSSPEQRLSCVLGGDAVSEIQSLVQRTPRLKDLIDQHFPGLL